MKVQTFKGVAMQKIISLFKRDYTVTHLVYDEVVPGAEWVLAGEGIATRKHDGTCCMIRAGILYKRYDAKRGIKPPAGFIPAQEPDTSTGHWPGWLLADKTKPEDKYHFEAFDKFHPSEWPDGTYELIGPKVQGNPEKADSHMLVLHGSELVLNFPRTFEAIKAAFADFPGEGVVFHHPDGRMVKIKKRDFYSSGPKRKS